MKVVLNDQRQPTEPPDESQKKLPRERISLEDERLAIEARKELLHAEEVLG
jgi:hypothetical protein